MWMHWHEKSGLLFALLLLLLLTGVEECAQINAMKCNIVKAL